MKKFKLFNVFIVVMLFFIFSTINVRAEPNNNKPTIDDISSIIAFESYTKNNIDFIKINKLQEYKNLLIKNYPELTNKDLAKLIRLAAGENENVVSNMDDEIMLEALSYQEVYTEVTYFKVDENGNQVKMEKGLFNREVTLTKINQKKVSDSKMDLQILSTTSLPNPYFNWFSSDGYLKITSTAIKTCGGISERDFFYLSGTAEWLIIPSNKFEDILVIASSANIDHTYNHYGSVYYEVECQLSSSTGNHHIIDKYTTYAYKNNNTNSKVKVETPNTSGLAVKAQLNGKRCTSQDYGPAYGPYGHYYHHTTKTNKLIIFGQYKVSLYNIDSTCLVAYSHKVHSLANMDVSISVGLPASVGISFGGSGWQKVDYYADAYTLYYGIQYTPVQHSNVHYVANNDSTHTKYCSCSSVVENHYYQVLPTGNIKCRDCGHIHSTYLAW